MQSLDCISPSRPLLLIFIECSQVWDEKIRSILQMPFIHRGNLAGKGMEAGGGGVQFAAYKLTVSRYGRVVTQFL